LKGTSGLESNLLLKAEWARSGQLPLGFTQFCLGKLWR